MSDKKSGQYPTHSSRAESLVLDDPEQGWTKSQRTSHSGNTLSAARTQSGHIAIRNEADPEGPAILAPEASFLAMLLGAKDGDFDSLFSGDTQDSLSDDTTDPDELLAALLAASFDDGNDNY